MKKIAYLLPTIAGFGALLAWNNRKGESISGRLAVVTGGSRGLGLAIARRLISQGAIVALVARDKIELELAGDQLKAHGGRVSVWPCDLTVLGEAGRVIQEIHAYHGRIDILINNAGVISVGPFEEISRQDFDRSLAIHLTAPLETMQTVVPYMRQRGWGRIVNIASIGGKVGVPHLSAYCAGKFALVGLSDSLRAELAKDKIRITTVCPGLMRTGSHLNASFKGDHQREFRWFALGACLPLVSMDADRAAGQIVAALRRGQAELVISVQAKAAILANAIAPGLVAFGASLANLILPSRNGPDGKQARTGWQSLSKLTPSILTSLGNQAAVRNNELRKREMPDS